MSNYRYRTHFILFFVGLFGGILLYSFGEDILSNILCYIMHSNKSQMISFSEFDLIAGQAVWDNTSPKVDRLLYKYSPLYKE